MAPTKIAVHARLRPAAERDGLVREGDITLVRLAEGDVKGTISVPNPQNLSERHLFTADAVYGPETTQQEVFDSSVKPLLNGVFKGINTTVFAYGVTGSGKTHTMQGGTSVKEQGIIPRVMKAIFRRRDAVKKLELSVSYSYVQILNDEVWDLLPERSDSQPAKQLKICSTGHKDEIVVVDMTKHEATCFDDFEADYARASSSRKTAATLLNSTSSRSHAILTIYVQTRELDSGKVFESKISLVDLAGSEDIKVVGTDKARFRESQAINKSLTQLGTVIDAINTGAAVVPYRESKLTRMLQETLGGNSLSILLLNLAPGEKYAKHTLRTLQFSTRARQVESNPQARVQDLSRIHGQPAGISTRPAGGMGAPVRANATAAPIRANAQAGPSRKPLAAPAARPSGAGPVRPPVSRTNSSAPEAITPAIQALLDEKIKTAVDEAIRKKEEETAKKQAEDDAEAAAKASVERERQEQDINAKEKLARAKVLVEQGREMANQQNYDMAIMYMRQAVPYVADASKLERLQKRIAELELVKAGQIPSSVVERKLKKEQVVPADVSSDSLGGPLKRSKAPRKPLASLAASTNRLPDATVDDSGKEGGRKGKTATASGPAKDSGKTALVYATDKENVGVLVEAPAERKRKIKSSKVEDDEYQPDETVTPVKKTKRPERRAVPKIPVYVEVSD